MEAKFENLIREKGVVGNEVEFGNQIGNEVKIRK